MYNFFPERCCSSMALHITSRVAWENFLRIYNVCIEYMQWEERSICLSLLCVCCPLWLWARWVIVKNCEIKPMQILLLITCFCYDWLKESSLHVFQRCLVHSHHIGNELYIPIFLDSHICYCCREVSLKLFYTPRVLLI